MAPRITTARRRRIFLETLRAGGIVTAAAEAAGWSRNAAYHHRKADPTFAEKWDEACEMAADALEAEARRRAVEGVQEPLVARGAPVYRTDPETGETLRDAEGNPVPLTITRYSDRLLEIMLKAKRPHEYKDRVSVDAKSSVAVSHKLPKLTREQRDELRRVLFRIHGPEKVIEHQPATPMLAYTGEEPRHHGCQDDETEEVSA